MTGTPRPPAQQLRILVLGYIVRGPLGGMTWHHLNYVLGLHRLGHDVWFLEDSDDYPSCYDPETYEMTADPGVGLRYARNVFDRAGLPARWAYYDSHTTTWMGPGATSVDAVAATADLLINVSGVNPLRPWLEHVPVKVLIDTDPAFTQIRHLTDAVAMAEAARHDVHLSFGANVGTPGCSIPDDGFAWRATRQPVVLDAWPVEPVRDGAPVTTIMQWDSYPARTFDGREYGMKSHSFGPFMDLPSHARGRVIELALGGATAPRDDLMAHGWMVTDPTGPSQDPWSYQAYIASSAAEFSVAKHGYVTTRSGWFSERSANYLASGRPVVVQDTGFGEWLPPSTAVVAFATPEEAADAIAAVTTDPGARARAARAAAAEHFASDVVLNRLLDAALA